MKDNRRNFIKKSGAMAAALSIGGMDKVFARAHEDATTYSATYKEVARDAGMQMCEAYFSGMDEKKMALTKQMDVLGAVSSINPRVAGLQNARAWDYETIMAIKGAWEKAGMQWRVIEGPPSLGERTKLGLAGRDEEISNFITLMKNLTRAGIDCICYNWMPVINWYRTKMDQPGRGGALVTAFDYEEIKNAPLTQHGEVSKETLWKNLEYFLKAVVPEAEKVGMKLALHPDDPQVDSIRGISRILTSAEAFKKVVNMYPSPSNGITMCQGNFALMGADLVDTIKWFGKRGKIHFVHFRNVQDLSGKTPSTKFTETFHDEGMIDMYRAMEAYYDIGFKGPIRPDHVPTMYGDSNDKPGYSTIGTLYALGYIRGLMESVSKQKNRRA